MKQPARYRNISKLTERIEIQFHAEWSKTVSLQKQRKTFSSVFRARLRAVKANPEAPEVR